MRALVRRPAGGRRPRWLRAVGYFAGGALLGTGLAGALQWALTGGRAAPARLDLAVAQIQGGPLAPDLRGTVRFERVRGETWVTVDVSGLPPYMSGDPPIGPHGFHIHERGNCEVGDAKDPFLAAGGHFNPDGQPHGNHAGDFPVLFSTNGRAVMRFMTHRFRPAEVVGHAVIIHENPDDFRSQPAGNSGPRLACGVINSG